MRIKDFTSDINFPLHLSGINSAPTTPRTPHSRVPDLQPKSESKPDSGEPKAYLFDSRPFGQEDRAFMGDKREVYTQDQFQPLINDAANKELPYYFMVVTKDKKNRLQALDASKFMQDFFQKGHKDSALNRVPIEDARFYMIKTDKLKRIQDRVFRTVCNLQGLRENRDHFAKLINACNPDLDPKERGRERFYMATCYMRKENFKEAFFWLNKSMEDGNYRASYVLASYYEKGLEGVVEKSLEKAAKCFQFALDNLPVTEGEYKAIMENDIKRVTATYS
jgi:TPR repeat protein